MKETNGKIRAIFEKTKAYIDPENIFYLAVLENINEEGMDAQIKMAAEDPEYRVPATKAQVFDGLLVMKFYRLLCYGMIIRAHEEELAKNPSEEAVEALKWGKEEAIKLHKELDDYLEENLNYTVIPIRTLVNI